MDNIMKYIGIVLIFLGCAVLLSGCTDQKTSNVNDLPKISGRVNDLGNIFSANDSLSLRTRIESLDKAKNVEVVILTLKQLPDQYSLEEYSNMVFNKWKIGKKGTDTGILLVLTSEPKRIRMEVGRGIEGYIPDMVSKNIINESMVPSFKQHKFYEGFMLGINRIDQYITNPL